MSSPESQPTFEQDMERLEAIVARLEEGGLPLDESLKLFEEGQQVLARCRSKLEKAKVHVEKLLASGERVEIDPDSLGR